MVTTSRLALAILALLWSAPACTIPEVPIPAGERHLVIHAVLNPAHREQTLSLTYSDNGAFTSPLIRGAVVTIMTPEDVAMTAVEDPPTSPGQSSESTGQLLYRINLDTHGVSLHPGGTYTLHVKTSDGQEAWGMTTLPEASAAAPSPTEIFRVSRDTLRLSWAPVVGAESYHVVISREIRFPRDTIHETSYAVFATKPVELAGNQKEPFEDEEIFTVSSKTTATVLAVDANYYNYYRRLADPFVGASPTRLTGAVGVFGSVVPVVVRQLDVRP